MFIVCPEDVEKECFCIVLYRKRLRKIYTKQAVKIVFMVLMNRHENKLYWGNTVQFFSIESMESGEFVE